MKPFMVRVLAALCDFSYVIQERDYSRCEDRVLAGKYITRARLFEICHKRGIEREYVKRTLRAVGPNLVYQCGDREQRLAATEDLKRAHRLGEIHLLDR